MSEPTWGPVQLEGEWRLANGDVVDPSLGTAVVTATREGDIITIDGTFSVDPSASSSIYFAVEPLPDEFKQTPSLFYAYTVPLQVNGVVINEEYGVTSSGLSTSPLSPSLEGATGTLRYLGGPTNVPPNPPTINPVLEDLNNLLQIVPGYSLLTDSMKQDALDKSVIPDSSGVWPGDEGYVPTYDIYWAAVGLLNFLKAQPIVRSTSSEGTSVSVDAPDWSGLIAYYYGASPIAGSSGSDILNIVPIPDGPHVRKVDMSGRGSHYGDIDTDLG